jgi:hypothetical protein
VDEKYYIEVACQQKNHFEARVCGDVFLSKRIKEEGRIIAVLSDGMGHGIKANLLATLTSTLSLSFTQKHRSVQKLAEIIMDTLPVNSENSMNYATFTIIDINIDGEVIILEYENPKTLIMRGTRPLEPTWNCIVLESEKSIGKEVLTTSFTPRKEDRILFCSDGIMQSGLGSDKYPVGWGQENFEEFIAEQLREESNISAAKLGMKVIDKANLNDGFHPKDDMSCGVIYFREPRKLMICTGPPQEESEDKEYAGILEAFPGRKIVCGATTADIISREWKKEIIDTNDFSDPELPPVSHMEGLDLITEGILTLSKVNELLKAYNPNTTKLGKGPADSIVRMILECDEIQFLAGTKINVAHQDPTLPVDLELRRTVVHRIARVLEEKFLKETSMRFF